MAFGISISLSSIPGVSSMLSKLDGMKADFLAVPARVNASLDRLGRVRQIMAQNNAPPSAQSDALQVEQHLRQVQSEWNAAASQFAQLDTLRRSGSVSLDMVSMADHLIASAGYVLTNEGSLTSAVDALAAKYLTAAQQAQVNITYVNALTRIADALERLENVHE